MYVVNQLTSKTCTNPGCHYAGIPQPLTNFYRQRVKGKLYYMSQCKACMNRKSNERHHRNMQRPEYRELRRKSGRKSYQTQKRKRMEETKVRLGL